MPKRLKRHRVQSSPEHNTSFTQLNRRLVVCARSCCPSCSCAALDKPRARLCWHRTSKNIAGKDPGGCGSLAVNGGTLRRWSAAPLRPDELGFVPTSPALHLANDGPGLGKTVRGFPMGRGVLGGWRPASCTGWATLEGSLSQTAQRQATPCAHLCCATTSPRLCCQSGAQCGFQAASPGGFLLLGMGWCLANGN